MNLGNRYSQHSFAQTPSVNTARSKFDRSFATKDTIDFDDLNPIFIDEIIPGDTINLNVKSFARLAPQVVPLMDNMYMDYFFFFVPTRLLWDNWERFNGAQDVPGASINFTIPVITSVNATNGSIYDKFGIPTQVTLTSTISALPFRAYNLIWNEWFRDQNLQPSLTVPTTNGPDVSTLYTLRKRGKRHDYFTSCLPFPQKFTAPLIPLTGLATVQAIPPFGGPGRFLNSSTGANLTAASTISTAVTTGNLQATTGAINAVYDPAGTLQTNLAIGGANISVNDLRNALMIQSLLELDARGGTRYVEILKAHFNVVSPDFRLQRPEYLSGGTVRITQHPIAQTSNTVAGSPQGNLAAFSTAVNLDNNIGFSKSFTEHGYVIGLCSARADLTYQYGLEKMWTRQTRYDFFWPKLQELGEQAVLQREIYATGTGTDNTIFGYQERYAEYRYKPSQIKGQFRSNFAQTLEVWHLAEESLTPPALNASFIESNTPIERSLVVPSAAYPHLLLDLWFDYKHARPIMTYGVPATLGRF